MDTFTFSIYEIVGVVGFILYLVAYFLLQVGIIDGHSLTYIVMNLIAACFVLGSLLVSFSWATLIIQLAWAFVSLFGLVRHHLPNQVRAEQYDRNREQLSHWSQCA